MEIVVLEIQVWLPNKKTLHIKKILQMLNTLYFTQLSGTKTN